MEEHHPPVADDHEHEKSPTSPGQIFVRGLSASLPALLTIVVVLWVANGLNSYIIQPATWTVKYLLAVGVDKSVPSSSLKHLYPSPPIELCGSDYLVTKELHEEYTRFIRRAGQPGGSTPEAAWTAEQQQRIEFVQSRAMSEPPQVYVQLGKKAVPYPVYALVAQSLPPGQVPNSAIAVYMEYVTYTNDLTGYVPLSVVSVLLIIILLYFLGRFVSARLGRWMFNRFEREVLGRLPLISNVYASAKQVTEFVFSEKQQVEYRRVVAVPYPRKGVWMIGFVTGDAFRDVSLLAQEPCLAVLIPTSPMPVTGFTVMIPRSEVLDLSISVEEAMQFCISCGVFVSNEHKLSSELTKRLIAEGKLKNTKSLKMSLETLPSLPQTAGTNVTGGAAE